MCPLEHSTSGLDRATCLASQSLACRTVANGAHSERPTTHSRKGAIVPIPRRTWRMSIWCLIVCTGSMRREYVRESFRFLKSQRCAQEPACEWVVSRGTRRIFPFFFLFLLFFLCHSSLTYFSFLSPSISRKPHSHPQGHSANKVAPICKRRHL